MARYSAIRYSEPNMNCPNCGLANPDTAKFCANCGTPLDNTGQPRQTSYQPPPPFEPSRTVPGKNSATVKKIGLGCLIAIALVLFFGLSCTRACFGRRRYYRRYAEIVRPAIPRAVISSVFDR